MGVKRGQGKYAGKPFRDDLLGVSVSGLRKAGVITEAMTSVSVRFGDLERTVGVRHRPFPKHGSWSFFVCPCGAWARNLRLYDGRVVCRSCDGLQARCQANPRDPTLRIERLRSQLAKSQCRRRTQLQQSLRRALVVERRKRVRPCL